LARERGKRKKEDFEVIILNGLLLRYGMSGGKGDRVGNHRDI
jgi:hypothetical protein